MPFSITNRKTKKIGKHTLQRGNVILKNTSLSSQAYVKTYLNLMRKGYMYKNRRHVKSVPMFLFGSTIMGTHTSYIYKGVLMPRANTESRPGRPGFEALKDADICGFARACEAFTLEYLRQHHSEKHKRVLEFKSRTVAHPELRVCGTIFTAMALVGNLQNGNNHLHMDFHDLCSCIIMVGTNIKGGSTIYYNGVSVKEPGEIVHEEKHAHGKVQIFPFEVTPHKGSRWIGKRGIISFYVNLKIVEHFETYGSTLYKPWLRKFNKK